jgi:hypothetical protein
MKKETGAAFCTLETGLTGSIQQMTNGGSMCLLNMRCIMTILGGGLVAGLLPMKLLGQEGRELPTANRVVIVDSDAGLNAAIKEVQAGDQIILEDGAYNGLYLEQIRGTVDLPIVFIARNSRKALIEGSHAGRNVKLSDCDFIEFHGIRFTGGRVWGVTMGPAFSEDTNSQGCRNIRLFDCEFDNASQSLLIISGGSHSIDVINCDFHDSGNKPGAKRPYAEGIYIGSGADLNDRSHNILIKGNRLFRIGNEDNWGEAIDIKCQSYNIRIVENSIQDVVLHSGGAITALFDNVSYPEGATTPSITIARNKIRGIRKQTGGWHGAGIMVGANGITVIGNDVSDTEGPSLIAVANGGNTTGTALVYGNVFDGEVVINKIGTGTVNQPLNVDFQSNVSP